MLGPLEVRAGPGEPLEVGGARLRTLLIMLALLEELVVAHPLREPLAARLMRALHASGRRGAAL